APLALSAARPKLATNEQLFALELREHARHVAAEPRARIVGGERPASLRVAQHELPQRLRPALEKHIRQPGRWHRAERVAIAPRVLGCDQPLLARDAHEYRPPLIEQRTSQRIVVLADPKIAAQAQNVVQRIWRCGRSAQLPLDLLDCVAVEEIAKLLLPQELAQQIAIERQRLRTALRRRRVVLVHVGRDVVEEKRGRVRRRRRGLHLDEIELAGLQPLQQRTQRRQVEYVLQALAVGLEDHGERAVLARDLQERL